MGSVFSPYYKWARRAGPADPMNHCALNVALYGPTRRRWTMTERDTGAVARETDAFAIGPSALRWSGDALVIDIDEIAAPLPRRVRGRVTVRPHALYDATFEIDATGRHRWRPLAPHADVEVSLTEPALNWRGEGYLDHNAGEEPLEAGFTTWDWSRAQDGARTFIHYDARTRAGGERNLALEMRGGECLALAPSAVTALPKSLWRVERAARSELGAPAHVVRTLEDTPFYARSIIEQRIAGRSLTGFHESLDLERFCAPVVQGMLPFRMPRRRTR